MMKEPSTVNSLEYWRWKEYQSQMPPEMDK